MIPEEVKPFVSAASPKHRREALHTARCFLSIYVMITGQTLRMKNLRYMISISYTLLLLLGRNLSIVNHQLFSRLNFTKGFENSPSLIEITLGVSE
jgi:hypothetical protein